MPQKKNLQALINKNKQKKGAATSGKKEDEDPNKPAASANQDEANDASSPDLPKTSTPKPNVDKADESSDDEYGYQIKVNTKIVAEQSETKKEDEIKASYMINDGKDDGSKEKDKPIKRKDASAITFGGGRPMKFSRQKNAAIGGDDFVAIDDIDDEGKQKKSEKNKSYAAANGGREFVNLGSTAVDNKKKFEEEKEDKPKPAERPRFFGKAKIGGGENKTQNTGAGPNTQYDFGVKYKSDNTEGGKRKIFDDKNYKEDDDGKKEGVRKDTRKFNKDKGRFGGKEQQQAFDNDSDDGFEVVKDKNAARRQQRVVNRTKDEDGEQESAKPTQPIKRGGAFGNLGGDSD